MTAPDKASWTTFRLDRQSGTVTIAWSFYLTLYFMSLGSFFAFVICVGMLLP